MRSWARLARLLLVACALSCGDDKAKGGPPPTSEARPPEPRVEDESGRAPTSGRARPGAGDDEASETSKLVYLVSKDNRLYSFEPRKAGIEAYRRIGRLECKSRGTPQSMAVDRSGFAWVFYDSGELFRVSVENASCTPTPYVHPSYSPLLGMGFTSVAPGSSSEKLYIMSPDFGLATVSMPSLSVSKLGKLAGPAELTGGGDGRLFHYEAWTAKLSEIDLASGNLRPLHTFNRLRDASAWAFARYAGKFYMFTSGHLEPSRTTEYDPRTGNEKLRDDNLGFIVVGAGQSTLVPRSDGAAEVISGDFPDLPGEPSARPNR